MHIDRSLDDSVPDAGNLLRRMCALIDQPALLVDAKLEVIDANESLLDLLDMRPEDAVGRNLFGLPDGRWNSDELRQVLAELATCGGEVRSTPEVDWMLGTVGCRTVRVSACRASGDPSAPLMITIREGLESTRRLAKDADMAKLLYHATTLAATSDSLDQTLEFCVYAVCELTGWPIGHVFLTPPSADEPLISTDVWRAPPDWDIMPLRQETASNRFYAGVGLPGRVWQARQICWIEAIADYSDWVRKDSVEPLAIKAAIGFPVQVGDRMTAVLEFFNTQETPRSAKLVTFCRHMAEPIGRVIERQETTRRLRAAKEASERASRAKSQFLANISHELRTPLTAVLGMLQLSLQEDVPPQVRDYLKTAHKSADSLLSLLNDVLVFSSLESGDVIIDSEPFSLRELLAQSASPYAPLAEEKGLGFQVQIDPQVPDRLAGDAVRLRQVVKHLVDNAVKFTRQGGVHLHVKLHDQSEDDVSLTFAVSDTGPGLSPNVQDRMFEGFTQLDSSFTRRHTGVGLGLAISRAVVERLGGCLAVESQPGRGCRFHFTVAFQKPRVGKRQSPGRRPVPPSAEQPMNGKREPDAAANPLSVLLAEDTPANQQVICSILRKRGHHVTVAANGREALEHIGKGNFDVVLLDLQMPEMDGYQVTAAIRDLERRTPFHTPIIALTAHSTERDRDACLAAGMDAYLAKPFDFTELIAAVEMSPVGKAGDSSSTDARGLDGGVRLAPTDDATAMISRETMKRLGGDEELLCEFIEVFNEDAPRLLQTLESAVSQADAAMIARTAHSLRGLAANFDAAPVIESASALEKAAKDDDLAEADRLVGQLSDAVSHLSTALDRVRRTLKSVR